MAVERFGGHAMRGWGLLLAFTVAWFAALGVRPLFNPDEGRYVEIPAAMLSGGDFILPHLDGVAYLEKPPLHYWLSAAALAVFGHNEFAGRFVTGLAAVLGIVGVFLLARRLWSVERALNAVLMGSSMLLYIVMGQLTTLDMLLTATLTTAIVAFAIAQHERDRRPDITRNAMLACWAAMAAATLTKGLIGLVLPGGILVLYTLLQRDWAVWRNLHLGKGLVLYLALVVPWFVAVEHAQPGAFDFLIIREHFQRYLTKMHDRYQPWWYFGMIVAAGSLPWLPQTVRALATGWRASAPLGRFDASRMLWVATIFIVVFFSLSDSKLAPYVLPVMPLLALLGSDSGSAERTDLRRAAVLLMILGGALLVLLLKLLHKPLAPGPMWRVGVLAPWGIGAAVALLLAGGLSTWLVARGRNFTARAVIAVAGFGVGLGLISGGGTAVAMLYSAKPILTAAGRLDPTAPVYTVDDFDWTLPFYLGHPVIPVKYTGELEFGLRLAPDRGIATLDGFESRWRADDKGYALIRLEQLPAFSARDLPMRILARDFDHALVSRQ